MTGGPICANVLFSRLGFGAAALGPVGLFDLVGAADGEGIGVDVFCDDGAGGDVAAGAEAKGSDQGAVAADKDAFGYFGAVLFFSVVVAGDGAGADIAGAADGGVAQISQMVGFGLVAEVGVFEFNKVADVGTRSGVGVQAEAGERTDECAGTDGGLISYDVGQDGCVVVDLAIGDDRAGADAAAFADAGFAAELNVCFDEGVAANFDIDIDSDARRTFDSDASEHQLICFAGT